jgi:hypothetical protein
MIIGYARVSTQDQNPELQLDALRGAGCEELFQEKATGKFRERPELTACLRSMRKDDTLVVWKLDRLARSLKDLVEIVPRPESARRRLPVSLTEAIDTTSSGGRLGLPHLRRARRVRAQPDPRAHDRRPRRRPVLVAARVAGSTPCRRADTRKAAAMLSEPEHHQGRSRQALQCQPRYPQRGAGSGRLRSDRCCDRAGQRWSGLFITNAEHEIGAWGISAEFATYKAKLVNIQWACRHSPIPSWWSACGAIA